MRHRRRRHSPAGFTLLEILIVIGVILLLVGIAVVGFNAYDKAASERQTKITMENLKGLLAAYERQTGTGGAARLNNLAGTAAGDPFASTAAPPAPFIAMTDAKLAGDVNPGAESRKHFDDYKDGKFNTLATRQVMAELRRIPDNRQQMESFPPKTILQVRNLPTPLPPNLTPVVVDAWGNPILFVPDGGLSNVKINGTALADPIRSPDRRPFFASAGPDGNFEEGDDNIYSFQ